MCREDSFSDSYDMYKAKLFALAWLLCRNRGVSQDLVSETMARALLQLQKGKAPAGELLPWLCRICINTFKDQQRKEHTKKKYAGYLVPDETANQCHACAMAPCRQEEFRACWSNVEDHIRLLPLVQAECLLLVARGFSYKEIEVELHIEQKAVKRSIEKGVRKLREDFHSAPKRHRNAVHS